MNATAAGPSHGSISAEWYSKNARTSCPTWYLAPHACGRSIIIACGASRPAATSSSNMLSSDAESLCPGRTTGSSFLRSSPKSGEASEGSRAASAPRLPLSALISPLCASARNGCASSQLGNVFVE